MVKRRILSYQIDYIAIPKGHPSSSQWHRPDQTSPPPSKEGHGDMATIRKSQRSAAAGTVRPFYRHIHQSKE